MPTQVYVDQQSTATSTATATARWIVEGYTKMRVWGLTQFKRVVYIDADALVMDDLDEVKDKHSSFRRIVETATSAGKVNPAKTQRWVYL